MIVTHEIVRLTYKFLLAALLLLGVAIGAWSLLRFLTPTNFSGIKFRYTPGYLSQTVVEFIKLDKMGDLKLQKDSVVFASQDPLTVWDTTIIYGFSGEDVSAKLRVVTNGVDLVQAKGGPHEWEWFYRPSQIGRVTFHCEFSGPGPYPGIAFNFTSEVRNRFGLTLGQQSIAEVIIWTVGLLASAGIGSFITSVANRDRRAVNSN